MSGKSFEELLKSKTEAFSPSPRNGMWESIASELPQKKKSKKAAFFLLPLGLVLGLGVLIYDVNEDHSNSENVLANNPILPSVQSSSEQLPEANASNMEIANERTINKEFTQTSSNAYTRHSIEKRNDFKYSASMNREDAQKSTDIESTSLPVQLTDTKVDAPATEHAIVHETEKIELEKQQNSSDTISVIANAEEAISKPDSSKTIYIDDYKPMARPRSNFLGLSYTAGKISTRVKLDNAYNGIEQYERQYRTRKEEDKGLYSFAFSAVAGMERNRHRISTGIQFFRMEYKMTVINVNEAVLQGLVTRFSTLDFNATDSFQLKSRTEGGGYVRNRYSYVSIPINYTFVGFRRGNFNLGIQSNMTAHFLTAQKGVLAQNEAGLYVKSKASSENHTGKFHTSAGLGLELSYTLNHRIAFMLRPQFQWSLSPIEKSRISTSYNWWSIGSGLQFFIR